MKNRTDIRIYNKCNHYVKKSFHDRKRKVEAEEALKDALHRWDECLVGCEDDLLRHEVVVNRIHNEVVGRYRYEAHHDSTGEGTEDGTLLRLLMLVDATGHRGHHGTEDEVGDFTDSEALGSHRVQEVLDELDQDTSDRTIREGTDQGWQIREVKLDKGRHEHRDRDLDELKHEGNRGQDADRGDVTGVFYVFHDVSPPHFVYCVSSGTPGLRQAGPSPMQKATRDSSSE